MVANDDSARPWTGWEKVGFRVASSYVVLYLFPFSITMGWLLGLPKPVVAYESLWHRIVPWFSAHVLHLSYPITIYPEVSGGSDTTYDWVRVLCFALVAVVATIVWSALDRKRAEYVTLYAWLRTYVRVVVACAMFVYGGGKVIPAQMLPPSLTTLMQPFGDLTPYQLGWSYIGASVGYETFAGTVEVLGGVLLLIPGLSTLGALVTIGAMSNVFMINIGYGVPVKLWALHLLLFAGFLLLPDVRRLLDLFVLNRPVEPAPRSRLTRRPWANRLIWGLQWVLGLYVLGSTMASVRPFRRAVERMAVTNPLHGIWRVDEFVLDGEPQSPLLTDSVRWQRVVISSPQTLSIQDMDGRFSPHAVALDTASRTLWIKRIRVDSTSSPWWSEWQSTQVGRPKLDAASPWRDAIALTYDRQEPGAMTWEGVLNGHRLRVALKKEDRTFMLVTRGVHWIKDSQLY
jgi:hypothetical protein